MLAFRAVIGLILAGTSSVSYHSREPVPTSKPESLSTQPESSKTDSCRPVASEEIQAYDLEPIASEFYAKGQYKEALDAYTRWQPQSGCAQGVIGYRDRRYHQIALCHVHLNDYAGAEGACLDAASGQSWMISSNT
jgi:hypothetical protein